MIVTLLINFVISIIALPIIHRLAKRWTRPLTSLDNEIDAITPQSDRLQTLAVPQQPLEVRKLRSLLINY